MLRSTRLADCGATHTPLNRAGRVIKVMLVSSCCKRAHKSLQYDHCTILWNRWCFVHTTDVYYESVDLLLMHQLPHLHHPVHSHTHLMHSAMAPQQHSPSGYLEPLPRLLHKPNGPVTTLMRHAEQHVHTCILVSRYLCARHLNIPSSSLHIAPLSTAPHTITSSIPCCTQDLLLYTLPTQTSSHQSC